MTLEEMTKKPVIEGKIHLTPEEYEAYKLLVPDKSVEFYYFKGIEVVSDGEPQA